MSDPAAVNSKIAPGGSSGEPSLDIQIKEPRIVHFPTLEESICAFRAADWARRFLEEMAETNRYTSETLISFCHALYELEAHTVGGSVEERSEQLQVDLLPLEAKLGPYFDYYVEFSSDDDHIGTIRKWEMP